MYKMLRKTIEKTDKVGIAEMREESWDAWYIYGLKGKRVKGRYNVTIKRDVGSGATSF